MNMKAKRRTIYLWITACLMTALSSCTVVDTTMEPAPFDGEQVAVKFATSLDVTPPTLTRAGGENGNVWTAGDSVGVYMVKSGGNFNNIVNNARNYPYKTVSGGTGMIDLTPVKDTLYYPLAGKVNFIIYSPYTELTSSFYHIDLSNQGNQDSIDFMYTHDTNDYDHTSGKVEVSLRHQLSKLVFIVRSSGSGSAALSGMSMDIERVADSSSFSLSTGVLADGGAGGQATISAKVNPIQGDSVRAEAIVLPIADVTKVTLLLNVGGKEYHAYLPAIAGNKTITAGNRYTYHVSLDITRVDITGSLTPWNIVDGGAVDFTDTIPNPVTPTHMDFMYIRKGTFMMGRDGAVANEAPQHSVTITRDFYLGKFEVTNIQFAAFLNTKGIVADGMGDVEGFGRQRLIYPNATASLNYVGGKWVNGEWRDNCPVVDITWYGAKAFADWMGCSLPTEAQWEHACRAGTTTVWYFGDTPDRINDFEWYVVNSTPPSYQGGEKKSNPRGLYDMSGNVSEMCADWFTPVYSAAAVTDPIGSENNTGSGRTLRGGHIAAEIQNTTSTTRSGISPDAHSATMGFRLAYNF
jgi:formylglycine-generating enzyme required for sulfatase activity